MIAKLIATAIAFVLIIFLDPPTVAAGIAILVYTWGTKHD